MRRYLLYLLLLILFPFSVCSNQEGERFNYLEHEIREYSVLDKQYSLGLLHEMYAIAGNSSDSVSLKARSLYAEAVLNQRQGISDSTIIDRINQQLQHKDLSEHDEILLKYALSNVLISREEITDAFDISLQILEKSEQLNDSLFVARILNSLGVIAYNVSSNDLSREYYKKAEQWIEPFSTDYTYFLIKINLLTTKLFDTEYTSDASKKKELDREISLLMSAIEEQNREGLLLLLLLNTSKYWSKTGEKEKTLEYLIRAQKLCRDNSHIQSLIANNLGIYYLYEIKDFPKAMSYFQEAKETMEHNNMSFFLSSTYYDISATYEQMNRLDSALYYLKESVAVSNELKKTNQVSESQRKYITASLEASESRLALAESQIGMRNRQFIIILISAFAFITIGFLLFVIFWQKQKGMRQQVLLKEAESKELAIRLEREQMLKKLQENLLEDKLREITSYSLQLASKNQALSQVVDILKEFPDADKLMKKRIKNTIKDNQQTDNDWDDFLLHFNKVHPLFFEKMHGIYPDISQHELRLAAYIRLNLSIKQIAQMLNVTPESIKTSRYRLRKKMGLSKEESLDNVILTL